MVLSHVQAFVVPLLHWGAVIILICRTIVIIATTVKAIKSHWGVVKQFTASGVTWVKKLTINTASWVRKTLRRSRLVS